MLNGEIEEKNKSKKGRQTILTFQASDLNY
jgi:hypothetical protein